MSAFINARWPRTLAPKTCVFGRSRNDVRQVSPRTRNASIIRMGRPLWAADCTWEFGNNSQLAHLRYYLEKLEGYAGTVQIWNFASPFPFGIDFGTGTISAYQRRQLWTYLGTQYGFTWSGLPSHWVGGSVAALAGAHSAGDTTIDVDGLEASKIAVVTGQYVQIGRRLYLAAADATANGSGQATIELTSGLLAAAADNADVRLVEAGCEMQMTEQSFSESSDANTGLTTISARFIETVEDAS